MPRYLVLNRFWTGDRLCQPGEIVNFDGKPSDALRALDEPAVTEAAEVVTKPADEGKAADAEPKPKGRGRPRKAADAAGE